MTFLVVGVREPNNACIIMPCVVTSLRAKYCTKNGDFATAARILSFPSPFAQQNPLPIKQQLRYWVYPCAWHSNGAGVLAFQNHGVVSAYRDYFPGCVVAAYGIHGVTVLASCHLRVKLSRLKQGASERGNYHYERRIRPSRPSVRRARPALP